MKPRGYWVEIEGCPDSRRLAQWLDGAAIRIMADGNSAVFLVDSDPATLRAAANRIWDLGMTIVRIVPDFSGETGPDLSSNEEE